MASGGSRWLRGFGWADQSGSGSPAATTSGPEPASVSTGLRAGCALTEPDPAARAGAPNQLAAPQSPPSLSTKQVTEPGSCPNLSSEISRQPLPFAGNSEDSAQHVGRKEAELGGRQGTWL